MNLDQELNSEDQDQTTTKGATTLKGRRTMGSQQLQSEQKITRIPERPRTKTGVKQKKKSTNHTLSTESNTERTSSFLSNHLWLMNGVEMAADWRKG